MLKQAENLFPDEIEREKFLAALESGSSREPAIIVLQERPEIRTFPRLAPLPWQPDFVHRLHQDFRPGQHPLYEKGSYYSLDLSSVFSASLMMAIPNLVRNVLDVCSAPGGKAIFASRAFSPERLMCNETIRKRTGSLIDNLHRCQIRGAFVWSADPSVYVKHFPHAYDLVLVDAPCSGQSLLAKGRAADGCWSPEMIDMCVGRQRRILGNAIRCVRPGGYLLYATCTYAMKENEKVVQWMLDQHPEVRAVEVETHRDFRSAYSPHPCYRLFPQSGLGAGAFGALFQVDPQAEIEREFVWPPADQIPAIWRSGDPARKRPIGSDT